MEEIVKILEEQGMNPVNEGGYLSFSHQNINFLYLSDDRDKSFYSMYVPGLLKVDGSNKCAVLEVVNAINNEVKSVKLTLNGEYVWAGLEQKLVSDMNMERVVMFSVDALLWACHLFYEKWNGSRN